MRINLIADKIEITDKMKEIINKRLERKLEKFLHKFNDEITTATVKVSTTPPNNYLVNFDMWLPGNAHIFAKAESENFSTTVGKLADEVSSQLKTYKEKTQEK